MFDWLFEGRAAVYAALGAAAVVLAFLWWRDRRRHWLFALGGVAALAAGYFLLDRLVETRGEQIARRLQEIARAVRAGDADGVMEHISPQFDYHGVRRDAFRASVRERLKSAFVQDLTIWNVHFPDATGNVVFDAKPKGGRIPDNAGFLVRATFVHDADGQWRMQTFEVFDPLVNSQSPIDVLPWIR